jgi:hypothetical protein
MSIAVQQQRRRNRYGVSIVAPPLLLLQQRFYCHRAAGIAVLSIAITATRQLVQAPCVSEHLVIYRCHNTLVLLPLLLYLAAPQLLYCSVHEHCSL